MKKKKTLPPYRNFIFENIYPILDNGRYPIKREAMDTVSVKADVYRHGHEKIEVFLFYRKSGQKTWRKVPMKNSGNDRWEGEFRTTTVGYWEFQLEALTLGSQEKPERYEQTFYVRVDPVYARTGTWYEMFPRSQGSVEGQSATWDDCIARLDEIEEMGFDTIYLTPIHPIGETNRKGPNNSLKALAGDPGCPYAIGNKHGGHYDIDPELGTLDDFARFVEASRQHGFRLALDIALNCSPDHPHVKEHPEWFYHEADGSIKCAENPPKKYEDIYPYNFDNEDRQGLWEEIRDMMLYWADKGIDIFRIDNPHTKPFAFWEWVIAEIKLQRPELVFLAEAFTRPKIMKQLGKLGFDMSYTYFTWRTEKWEIEEYFKELTTDPLKQCMRGILFPSTPDIQPEILQNAPASAFRMRWFLAATLSSLCGMYNGYELCESTPFPGKEELLDSEKYQYKTHDWNAPGNIKKFIAKINRIRQENPALWEYESLNFHHADNDQISVYSRKNEVMGNTLLCAVNLDIHSTQATWVDLDLEKLGIDASKPYSVTDLIDNSTWTWTGSRAWIQLDPAKKPGHIFLVRQS